MKKLGIIGGLGPMATAYFLQLVVEMTDACNDQEHIEVLLHSKPQTPDRTNFILGRAKEDPQPYLLEMGKSLTAQGADVLAIPCITAHYFQKELEKEVKCPIIHAIEETAEFLKNEQISCVGIMATDGTIESGLFQTVLEQYGIKYVLPQQTMQNNVMHLIYKNVKAGKSIEMDRFKETASALFENGAEVILLGCTELSMIKRDYCIGKGFLDVMEVLARKAVLSCGTLKPEYEHLITK